MTMLISIVFQLPGEQHDTRRKKKPKTQASKIHLNILKESKCSQVSIFTSEGIELGT